MARCGGGCTRACAHVCVQRPAALRQSSVAVSALLLNSGPQAGGDSAAWLCVRYVCVCVSVSFPVPGFEGSPCHGRGGGCATRGRFAQGCFSAGRRVRRAQQPGGWLARRQGKARQGKARQGKARQGKARQGKARQGKARQGKARQGKARQGRRGASACERAQAAPKNVAGLRARAGLSARDHAHCQAPRCCQRRAPV
jgi:hypothetical protein